MMQDSMTILGWFLHQLTTVAEQPVVLVRDPLHLLPEKDSNIHTFASEHGYTVIIAATNLAFRELYELAIADPEVQKLLVIDRTPKSRLSAQTKHKAPPLFYPDLLARVPQEARIDLDLRQYLREITGDPGWPQETNDPRYVRIITRYLNGVIQAHQNLRIAHRERFSDNDFQTIVAYSALDVAKFAFQKLDHTYYWHVGLHGFRTLEELEHLAPTVTAPIKKELEQAPAPFQWFGRYETDMIIRAFYLSVILAQHLPSWKLVLTYIDPSLKELTTIEPKMLTDAAQKLINLDAEQAKADLADVEEQLGRDALRTILIEQLSITDIKAAAAVLEKEQYSTLFRILALLVALEDLVSSAPDLPIHEQIRTLLFTRTPSRFVESRSSLAWSNLKEAYRLAYQVREAHAELTKSIRQLKVMPSDKRTFLAFRDAWNTHGVNRLEFYLSTLNRLVYHQELVPEDQSKLPVVFIRALENMKDSVRARENEATQQIDELNRLFQETVQQSYPDWLAQEKEVYFTSQFIRRCLKPYWDPATEKAVVLVFDGMRYDIWDELLRPTLLEKMDVVQELVGSAILPSETHVSRWAIASGATPDQFGLTPRRAESDCLKEALERDLDYRVKVETTVPDGAGTGETVRYRAGNLEYYIFEFCDKELHKIAMKELPDGRKEPSRPLSFVYQQYVKNLIDTEVMSIVRRLAPGTKVFITADHGFGRVGQEWLGVEKAYLNEPQDCVYLNCLLSVPLERANLHPKVWKNVIGFTPEQLRYPKQERFTRRDGTVISKEYKAVLFPKVGYSFSRPNSHYAPDAYGHGGISLQELIIPMVILQVKAKAEEILKFLPIAGPKEVVEGEEIEFRMRVERPKKSSTNELRIDVEASYSQEQDRYPLPKQVLYVPKEGKEIIYRFRPDPDDATPEEHRQGVMKRELMLVVRYKAGERVVRNIQQHSFAVRLNSERIVRRVPTALGNILGLTPKSMR